MADKPKTAADCLRLLYLQPHERAMTEALIEEYAGRMAYEAAGDAVRAYRARCLTIQNDPLREEEEEAKTCRSD